MKVLLIEPDHEMRQSLLDRLRAENVETIYQAGDLADALDFVRDADAILCDDAFPIIAGEPRCEQAWSAMREAALGLAKPFFLITDDPDTWLEARHEETQAFKKKDAAEAVHWLVSSLSRNALLA